MGALSPARKDRQRHVRRRVSRQGYEARLGSRAEAAQLRLRTSHRSAQSRPRAPPQRRHGVRHRPDRWTNRHLDGVRQRTHARQPAEVEWTIRRARSRRHRRGSVPGARCGPRGRTGARRRQGPQRHARGRRTHGADGFRHRQRSCDRSGGERIGRNDFAGTPLYVAPAAPSSPPPRWASP